jgi:hypothetical protein
LAHGWALVGNQPIILQGLLATPSTAARRVPNWAPPAMAPRWAKVSVSRH